MIDLISPTSTGHSSNVWGKQWKNERKERQNRQNRQNHSTTTHWHSVGLSCDDWGWRTLAQWTDCGVQDSTLIWLNTVSYPSASSHQEMMDVVSSNTQGGCSVQTRLDRCKRAERVSPATSHHHYQLPSVNRDSSREATFFQSPTVQNALSCCQVIGSLAICIHKLLNVRLIKLFLLAIFAFFLKFKIFFCEIFLFSTTTVAQNNVLKSHHPGFPR